MQRLFHSVCGAVVLLAWPAAAIRADELSAESLPIAISSHDWPGFLGPHRNGKSDETGLPESWPAEGPPLVWRKPIGTGYAAPAIAEGRLYHFSRHAGAARLVCLDAVAGDEAWRVEYPTDFADMLGYNNGPRATPVVDSGRVYTFGAEGVLQCVGAEKGGPDDGRLLWRVDVMKDFHVVKNFFGVGSTPLVWRNLVVVNVGGSPPGGADNVYAAEGRVATDGAAVVAFDKLSGKVRWKTGDDLASYSSPVAATIGGRELVLQLARGGLLAIDPAKGETVATFAWRAKKLESVNASTPVVVGDEVFISETYELGGAVVRLVDGKFGEVWTDRDRRRDQALALHWNTPIEHQGFLYGSSGYHTPEAALRCVEWKTGKVRWSHPGLGRSSLTYADGKLICLSEDGALRILRATPEKYEELAAWQLEDESGDPLLEYPAWAAPAVAKGLLYLQDGRQLVCLRLGK